MRDSAAAWRRHFWCRSTASCGRRVRGVVAPHGGGDGGRHGTGKAPRTPWGQLTLGYRTRRRKDVADLIAKPRHDGKEEEVNHESIIGKRSICRCQAC